LITTGRFSIAAESQNADVGLADDRQAEIAAETPDGDGEGASCTSLGLEFLGAGRSARSLRLPLDAEEIFFVGRS